MSKNINEGFIKDFIKGFKDGYKSVINKSKSKGLVITDTVIKRQEGPVEYILLTSENTVKVPDASDLFYSVSAVDAEKYPIMAYSEDDWVTFTVIDPRTLKTLETVRTGKHTGPGFNFTEGLADITKVLNKYNLKEDQKEVAGIQISGIVNKILEGADVRKTLSELTIPGLGLDDIEIDPFRNGGHDGDYMELPNGTKISSSKVLGDYIDSLGNVISLRDIVTPTRKALNFIDVGAKDLFLPNQNRGNGVTTTFISVEVDGKRVAEIGQGTEKLGVRDFWVNIDGKEFYYSDTKSIVEVVYTEFFKGLNKTLQSLYRKYKKSLSVIFHIGSVGYDYKTISCRWSPDTGFVLD